MTNLYNLKPLQTTLAHIEAAYTAASVAPLTAWADLRIALAAALAERCKTEPPVSTKTENYLIDWERWNGRLDVNARVLIQKWDTAGYSHLHIAAIKDDLESALWLIANGADVNAKGNLGLSPLHEAAWNIAVLLLERDADVNAKGNDDWTPLHMAANERARKTAALLLERGAEINAKNNIGWTPLDVAESVHAREITALLRERGGKRGEDL